ncbi:hypothetical protein PB1_08522 [Bacillus methanolicus PB1]|uniref:Uncharacterized protein n=1 Tax=Bacillus methanolicus PB1 TaxID=997296 RepID=I3E1L9_BACMT|nr:hypothetical protein [Bacillus methanolicus]EIJ80390.1 hypothetical protein PB1_08522 [Bacillus methanolicus PB1]
MHFRDLFVKGLIIAGTALFFPTGAFADKAELAQKPDSQSSKAVEVVKNSQSLESSKVNGRVQANSKLKTENEAVQNQASTNHSQQVKPEKSPQKIIRVPDQASEKARKAIQVPNQASVKARKAVQVPNQASVKARKAVQVPNQASVKARKTLQSTVKRTEKAVNNTIPEKVEVKQGVDKGQTKQKKPQSDKKGIHSITNEVEKPSAKSLLNIDSGEKTKHQYTKMFQKLDNEKLHQSILKNEGGFQKTSFTDESKSKGKEKTPSRQERYLRDIQVVNSPQNTKIPGGSTKDRTGHSQSTVSFGEKWLELEKYWNLKLIQPYVDRAHVYRNQWVNAPPSPPPKDAPFFLNVYQSKSHG